MCRAFGFLTLVVAILLSGSTFGAETDLKAGSARVVITPEKSMWMAGYAARKKPSEGTAQELYAKALALEDVAGTRLVIVTTDLIGIPRPIREQVEQEVQRQFKLPPAALLLNSSHTHCGPMVRTYRARSYGIPSEQQPLVEAYVATLQTKLVHVIGEALKDLQPARLSYNHARCGFAMNRRLPSDNGYRNSPYPDGPVDHSVPVLRVESPTGDLRTVLFGYACHNTTLSFFQFCGDYAGYAQEYLEEAHPGTTAMFVMGCGGDQNPYPRGTLDLARQHGRSLANAVEAALLPRPMPVRGPLRVAMKLVDLEFATPPTREELQRDLKLTDQYRRRHAELLLEELEQTGRIRTTYPYPVQVVRFGDDMSLVALGGEVVVDYALRLKREFKDTPLWVAGYSNDVFGYVPSLRVLNEGGYEGGGAMIYTNLPGPFAPSVEERIITTVHELLGTRTAR